MASVLSCCEVTTAYDAVEMLLLLLLQHLFNGHFPGQPRLAGTRMSPFWILLELRMMDVVVVTALLDR